jgi:hypothetical protein
MNPSHILTALKKLVEHEIPCVKSNRKGYDFFIDDIGDDIPITAEENESTQAFGIHLSKQEVIDFAKTL